MNFFIFEGDGTKYLMDWKVESFQEWWESGKITEEVEIEVRMGTIKMR